MQKNDILGVNTARTTRMAAAVLLLATLLTLAACTEPPSWQTLLAGKIAAQYPGYQVQAAPGGGLLVQRPGQSSVPVDVDAIAKFCQRGPKDCNYATDQMLLELQGR